jgi:hypothetical protein
VAEPRGSRLHAEDYGVVLAVAASVHRSLRRKTRSSVLEQGGDTMTTSAPTSDPQVLADPHGLVATGEPLATLPELARMIGCSGRLLHSLLSRRLSDRVRHVRYRPGATRYHVQDVLTAVEP